jgi:HD domain
VLRTRTGRTVFACSLALAALAAVAWLSHPAPWRHGSLHVLVALAIVAFIAFAAETVSRRGIAHFDAVNAVALCTLALFGPLPALAVWWLPDVVGRVRGQGRLRSTATLVNVTAYAWACLAGSIVIGGADFAHVFMAGVVMELISFLLGPAIYATLHEGVGVRAALRPFSEMAAAMLAMVAVATATAILAGGPLGVLALALFALAVPVPQLAAGWLLRSRTVAALAPGAATRVYAAALSDVLRLSDDERRVLDAAVALAETGELRRAHKTSVVSVTEATLYREERWDGRGGVAGLRGEWIPRPARVLAVAQSWAGLTAAGSLGLAQREAMLALAAESGTRFDPAVVHAAAAAVEAEAGYSDEPCFEPRLHTLPLPRALRRRALPALLTAAVHA